MVVVNYLAVLVVAVVSMIIGTVWYGPLFGKPWQKLMGFTEEHMKDAKTKGMSKSYLILFIGSIVTSWVLATFVASAEAHYGMWTAGYGVHIAFYLWLGFIAPVALGSVLWEGKSWKLWMLNVGYYLVNLCIAGAILGAWH